MWIWTQENGSERVECGSERVECGSERVECGSGHKKMDLNATKICL